jgi:hypothetical protein
MSVWEARQVTAWEQALVAEAARKGSIGWVDVRDPGRAPRALWLVWHDDAVVVVTGGGEQPDPGLSHDAEATLILRSKETQSRVVAVEVRVTELTPDSEAWTSAAEALHAKRLNSVNGETTVDRWRGSSRIWRLSPTGVVVEAPGSMHGGPHRAVPVVTSATTEGPTPLMIGRRPRRRPL